MSTISNVIGIIGIFQKAFWSRSSKSYIQSKQVEYSIKGSVFILENIGPGPAHNIKLKTFGISKINDTKNDEFGLSEAAGPSTLKQDEMGKYLVPFPKYRMQFPFLIEWESATNEKSKSFWIYDSKNHKPVFLKKMIKIEFFFKFIFNSIFKTKKFQSDPSVLPKEKE